MSFQTCWRCLSRATDTTSLSYRSTPQPWSLLQSPIAPFSTSVPRGMPNPVKKKSPVVDTRANKRGVKKTFTKKKKDTSEDTDRSRRPKIGERKALRKRIVVSNTNALEVEGMRDINAESILDGSLRGQVLGIPGPVVDQLRAVEAFKVSQGWPLFRRPAMLIRQETVDLGKEMQDIEAEGSRNTIRRVLVGERGSGKTLMLLQAMTMAFLKGWIVINIPEAQDLILACTEYGPVPSISPTLYFQKTYTASLLSAIQRANPILQDLQLSQPKRTTTETPVPTPQNISLARLATLGASDPEIAYSIFQQLMRELTLPNRPPLLLCMDGLAHAMQNSHYISQTYAPIHAHDLALIRWFLNHLSGASSLPNGGIVLAATSNSNNPVVPTLDLALKQLEEGQERVQRDPYKKYDERVFDVFRKGSEANGAGGVQGVGGVQVKRLGGVTKGEARSLMEYWARSGVCRQRVDDGFVGEKWALSGGGCVGELERAVVRMRV